MIPLFHVEGNKLISLKGEVSSFFELIPPDTEGLDRNSLESIYQSIESDLINNDGVLKLYFLGGRIFLNSFGELKFSSGRLIEKTNPIETFLGEEESHIHFYENYLTSRTSYFRLLSVIDVPQFLELGTVCNFPDFVLHIRKVSQLEARKNLQLKRRLHFSALFKGMKDIESEAAYEEAEALLEGLMRSEKALFDVEMFALIREKTKTALDELTQMTMDHFKTMDGKLLIEERGLSFFFQSIVPGVLPSFRRKFPCGSDYLSYLVPFHRDFVHEEGLKLQSRSGEKVKLSLFHPSSINFNLLITGTTGQGKSMFANELLRHEISNGTKAMVLDLGNSFRKSALYHEGEILSEKFNPFRSKDPWYLKAFIMAAMDENLSKKEQGRLFESIKRHLEKDVKSFSQFLELLEQDFKGIKHYFAEIESFFTDEVKSLSSFTYCDLTNYPESVKAPLIIYLIETFKQLEGQKVFVFDECWSLLARNADFIAECFRTFRKHRGSAIAISQNFDDFYQTQLGRVIIQNTFYKFFFKQNLAVSEFIDAHTQDLVMGISSIKGEYSEALFVTETQKKPIRFLPTPLKYELFTSDKLDNNNQDTYWSEKGRFLSYQMAMNNYVTLKYPHWRIEHENL